MSITGRNLICTRPFEWFEIHPDGSVFLCCPAWLKRPIGNLLQQNVDDIWNGAIVREIRKSILNGSFHHCSPKRCPKLAGGCEPVQALEAVEDNEIASAIKARQAVLDYLPRHLNLCFDFSCNLVCPSCRPKQHRAIDEELSKTTRIKEKIEQELLPHAKSLTLSGYGDPFASPSYFAILKQLSTEIFPHLSSVHLHSNGQLLTAALWNELPGLQPLLKSVEFSLDAATAATYRINRPGGSFEQLLENLAFLQALPIKRVISMVVQSNNWREIPLFFQLGERVDAAVYLSPLVNWGTFSKQEYLARAVHRPEHPEFAEFQTMLATYREHPRRVATALLPAGT